MAEPTGSGSWCRRCGHRVPVGASFCRSCGEPARPAATEAATAAGSNPEAREGRGGRGRLFVIALLVGLLAGAGAASGILLIDRGGEDEGITAPGEAATVPAAQASPTESGEAESGADAPAPSQPGESAAPGSLAAGTYVQAGSFREPENAEAERERLAGEGIAVEVIESDIAQELYPGFQVLIAGPFETAAAERSAVRSLRDDGVPSAFARPLTPAQTIAGPEAIAGEWTGTLDRSGSERPGIDGSLAATLRAAGDGGTAQLEFPGLGCSVDLSLLAATDLTLSYRQAGGCVGAGEWRLRPEGEAIALTLLPPQTDTIVLGNRRSS